MKNLLPKSLTQILLCGTLVGLTTNVSQGELFHFPANSSLSPDMQAFVKRTFAVSFMQSGVYLAEELSTHLFKKFIKEGDTENSLITCLWCNTEARRRTDWEAILEEDRAPTLHMVTKAECLKAIKDPADGLVNYVIRESLQSLVLCMNAEQLREAFGVLREGVTNITDLNTVLSEFPEATINKLKVTYPEIAMHVQGLQKAAGGTLHAKLANYLVQYYVDQIESDAICDCCGICLKITTAFVVPTIISLFRIIEAIVTY